MRHSYLLILVLLFLYCQNTLQVVSCGDKHCAYCHYDYPNSYCERCDSGYGLNDRYKNCSSCQIITKNCTSCTFGYISSQCNSCAQGFYLAGTQWCRSCSSAIEYCQKCYVPSLEPWEEELGVTLTNLTCTSCDYSHQLSQDQTYCMDCGIYTKYCIRCRQDKISSNWTCTECFFGFSLNQDTKECEVWWMIPVILGSIFCGIPILVLLYCCCQSLKYTIEDYWDRWKAKREGEKKVVVQEENTVTVGQVTEDMETPYQNLT